MFDGYCLSLKCPVLLDQYSLSGSLEGHQEEYPVDPDFDEGDEADEFLKNR